MSLAQLVIIFSIILGVKNQEIVLRTGVIPYKYLPYSDFSKQGEWSGFYGELLERLQERLIEEKTSIRLDFFYNN